MAADVVTLALHQKPKPETESAPGPDQTTPWIDIDFDDEEGLVLLSGTRDGLTHLVEAVKMLVDHGAPGDHIHLDEDPEDRLTADSAEIVIYLDPDEDFADRDALDHGDDDPVEARDIDDTLIAAVIFRFAPEDVPFRSGRPYPVTAVAEELRDGDEVKALYNGLSSRYRRMEIAVDGGVTISLTLHLDDPDLFFLTRPDIAHLVMRCK